MRIDFGRHVLTRDTYNWIIAEKRVRMEGATKGDVYETNHTFYGRLSGALRALVDKKLARSNATEIKELIDEIERISNHIIDTVSQYFEGDHIREVRDDTTIPNEFTFSSRLLDLVDPNDYTLIRQVKRGRGYSSTVTIEPLAQKRLLAQLKDHLESGREPTLKPALRRAIHILENQNG